MGLASFRVTCLVCEAVTSMAAIEWPPLVIVCSTCKTPLKLSSARHPTEEIYAYTAIEDYRS